MNEKILVVDDDELVRSGLAANLERAGFEVFTASDSRDVRACMDRDPVHLALCDLVLGDEDGMDILRYMQANHPQTAVVIITGHGSVRNALEALKGGASDYIQKPSDPEEVIHRIRMVLDSVNLRRTLMEERHRTEERKRILHEQLSRAERMSSLGALAEGAARDLKDILRPVEHLPSELRKKIEPMHEGQSVLMEIDAALRKASAVIRDLETIGKSNSLKKSKLHINELVQDYMKSSDYHHVIGHNPMVKVEWAPGVDLPPVAGSSGHLRQMVANLIAHGVESMPQGGVLRIHSSVQHLEPEVGRFSSRKSGDYVVLTVEDSATPLSEEDLERIFEPFYVRNRLGRHMLSGLGLTLIYRVVEDHSGYVDIRAAPPLGNVVNIYLPVSEDDDTAILELRPDYTGKERILLVDDSEAQRAAAAGMLQELGYEVTLAESGQEALAHLRERLELEPGKPPFDLLVIDLVLGDAFDGVETFKGALELAPAQKAILASGFADITRIVEAKKLGISRCFQKPYALEVLGKNIRLALDEGD
ncbi:MAG TPA: response regulator [Kiritimatiellia bacterium]|nr:response regulator [Kiritimatiellia bacterium]HMO97542.1 response regulator [Kiritimatiellia bacterium]HMP97020.1 response regulator [Kiritimatiellia bacterium]